MKRTLLLLVGVFVFATGALAQGFWTRLEEFQKGGGSTGEFVANEIESNKTRMRSERMARPVGRFTFHQVPGSEKIAVLDTQEGFIAFVTPPYGDKVVDIPKLLESSAHERFLELSDSLRCFELKTASDSALAVFSWLMLPDVAENLVRIERAP